MSESGDLQCIGHIRSCVTAPIEDVDVERGDVAYLEIDCRILNMWAGANIVINTISSKSRRGISRLTTRVQPLSICVHDFNHRVQGIVYILTLGSGLHMHGGAGQRDKFVVIIVARSRDAVWWIDVRTDGSLENSIIDRSSSGWTVVSADRRADYDIKE